MHARQIQRLLGLEPEHSVDVLEPGESGALDLGKRPPHDAPGQRAPGAAWSAAASSRMCVPLII